MVRVMDRMGTSMAHAFGLTTSRFDHVTSTMTAADWEFSRRVLQEFSRQDEEWIDEEQEDDEEEEDDSRVAEYGDEALQDVAFDIPDNQQNKAGSTHANAIGATAATTTTNGDDAV